MVIALTDLPEHLTETRQLPSLSKIQSIDLVPHLDSYKTFESLFKAHKSPESVKEGYDALQVTMGAMPIFRTSVLRPMQNELHNGILNSIRDLTKDASGNYHDIRLNDAAMHHKSNLEEAIADKIIAYLETHHGHKGDALRKIENVRDRAARAASIYDQVTEADGEKREGMQTVLGLLYSENPNITLNNIHNLVEKEQQGSIDRLVNKAANTAYTSLFKDFKTTEIAEAVQLEAVNNGYDIKNHTLLYDASQNAEKLTGLLAHLYQGAELKGGAEAFGLELKNAPDYIGDHGTDHILPGQNN